MAEDKLFERVGRVLPVGEILFRDGDEGQSMYVLRSGRIHIYKDVRGRQKTLAYMEAGDFFGEMALLNHKPRTATAEVVEEAAVLVIDSKMFEAMVVGNSEIAVRLIQRMAKRLDNANALIDTLMHRDPKARVILGLARMAEFASDERGSAEGVWVDLDAEELARQVGVQTEDVQSVITRLSRLGIVQGEEHGFRIPDVLRLHEFFEFLQQRGQG